MRITSTGVLATIGLLAVAGAAALWLGSSSWAVVAGPVRTPHLVAAGSILAAGLLVVALVRALHGPRSGRPRAWPTLLADGASALAVIGLVCWTAVVAVGLVLWTEGDRIRPVPGTGDRFVEEQTPFFSAHGIQREGVRRGLVVVWGPWGPYDAR